VERAGVRSKKSFCKTEALKVL